MKDRLSQVIQDAITAHIVEYSKTFPNQVWGGGALHARLLPAILAALPDEGEAAAEIARLQAKIDNITAQGIHSCHPDCQRPLCVLRRERDAAREASRELGKALERVLPHAEELSRSGLTDETCAEARRTLEKYGTKPVNFD